MRPPMQPLIVDDKGIVRFQANEAVRALLDAAEDRAGFGLNDLAEEDLPDEDMAHLAQLIGYSVSGYHELSYVSDEDAAAASAEARKLVPSFAGCRDCGCPIHSGVG